MPHHVFDLVSDLDFEDIVELDWWNSYRHSGLTITHVPSRHWGARVIKDSHRGYGGYVLRQENNRFITPGTPPTSTDFAKLVSASRPRSPYCRLAPTIRKTSATFTPALAMRPEHS